MSDEMTMAGLGELVDEEGGVVAITLGDLRDAVEADKLGKLVMGRISQELAAHGMGYFPPHVIDNNSTPRQHHQVRIYRKGSGTAARAIDAVLYPSGAGDQFLNELAGNDAQEVLDRVRELICPDA